MSDGLWSTPDRQELIQQTGYARMRLLRVSTAARSPDAASGFAALAPNVAPLSVSPEGGPHFLMSPQTPDGFRVEGAEWCLLQPIAGAAVPGAGGFTVTVWRLIDVTMQQTIGKQWASFAPVTGVGYSELYHSFDHNTIALRLQIGNVATDGDLYIAFCEI